MNKEEILNAFLLANIPEIITQEEFDDVKKTIFEMLKENQKYKEVIDKLKTNIENDIDGFRTINEFGENNEILELLDIYLDILKEVE